MAKKNAEAKRVPKLPELLGRKIYKTGQTRGADDDVIFQNRVSRASTVLIPYSVWSTANKPPAGDTQFENGFITLISPGWYFDTNDAAARLKNDKLELGKNAVVFYETREQWNSYHPAKQKWSPAESRRDPLGGQYVARVPATTAANDGGRIAEGFASTNNKGAGIRLYEYASGSAIEMTRVQLEVLVWHCTDSRSVLLAQGMSEGDIDARKAVVLQDAASRGLLDTTKLVDARVMNADHATCCPLCLLPLSAAGFFSRMAQAEGRETPDLTITDLNLFHIRELRYGEYNHAPYNLGWGHHHCNVVAKDAGIVPTLDWMASVLERNGRPVQSVAPKSGI